jgi:aryl-alcohol dehydrogenase
MAGHTRSCSDFAAHNLSGRRRDGSVCFPAEEINGAFFGQSSFGTHLLCRASRAIKVSADAPLEILACLGGEFLIGAGTVLHGFSLGVGDTLLIVGADAIGLAACMAARARGTKAVVIVDEDDRRRLLASQLGATVALRSYDALPELVRTLASEGVDFAFETTREKAAREACIASLKPGGVCAAVYPTDANEVAVEHWSSIRVADGDAAPQTLVPQLIALYEEGELPLDTLIDFFSFEHVNDALDALRNRHVAKPVLRFPLGGFGDIDRALIEDVTELAPETDGADEEDSNEKAILARVSS